MSAAVAPQAPHIPDVHDLVFVGEGGAAQVFRGCQHLTGREVAIKVFTDQLVGDEPSAAFRREVANLVTVSEGPFIARLYAGGVTPAGNPYLMLQWLPGGSLADRLEARGRLPWEEVLELVPQLCMALDFAHRCEVVHRDLKPANVLLDADGSPWLTDFGIATTAGNTVSKVPHFSVDYAAPEVIDGQRATPATDIYSLAAMLVHLVDGRPLFDGSYLMRLSAHMRTPPDCRRLGWRGVPTDAIGVLLAALAKDPADRPATVAELGHALTSDRSLRPSGGFGAGGRSL